jgi:hypothetical protein
MIPKRHFIYLVTLLLIILVLFQDIIALFFFHLGSDILLYLSLSLKELVMLVLILFYLIATKSRLYIFNSQIEVDLLLLLVFIALIYLTAGLIQYPVFAVLMEFRALFMPILILYLGTMVGNILGDSPYFQKLINFILLMSVIIAASGIIDYFFLDERFWNPLNVGGLEMIKGGQQYEALLPNNYYSASLGRRALGIPLNPLLLGYQLMPAFIIFFYQKRFLRAAITYLGIVVSLSRLPIAAPIASIALLHRNIFLKLFIIFVAAIGAILALPYLIVIFTDNSALDHYAAVIKDSLFLLQNPLGYGIGFSGIFATKHNMQIIAESGLINLLNQVGVLGALVYILFFFRAVNYKSQNYYVPLTMVTAYFLTIVLSPQIFVIKSSFIFLFFVGLTKKGGHDTVTKQV